VTRMSVVRMSCRSLPRSTRYDWRVRAKFTVRLTTIHARNGSLDNGGPKVKNYATRNETLYHRDYLPCLILQP
jgi:hypothetical protein